MPPSQLLRKFVAVLVAAVKRVLTRIHHAGFGLCFWARNQPERRREFDVGRGLAVSDGELLVLFAGI